MCDIVKKWISVTILQIKQKIIFRLKSNAMIKLSFNGIGFGNLFEPKEKNYN